MGYNLMAIDSESMFKYNTDDKELMKLLANNVIGRKGFSAVDLPVSLIGGQLHHTSRVQLVVA